MIEFRNVFVAEAPMKILLEVNEPDSEGWRQYHMSLVTSEQEDTLIEFDHSFSDLCVQRLKEGFDGLLNGQIDEFDFEPVEPAFRLKVSPLNPDEFEMLCIVDVGYVQGRPATETGIGMAIVVEKDALARAIGELQD